MSHRSYAVEGGHGKAVVKVPPVLVSATEKPPSVTAHVDATVASNGDVGTPSSEPDAESATSAVESAPSQSDVTLASTTVLSDGDGT